MMTEPSPGSFDQLLLSGASHGSLSAFSSHVNRIDNPVHRQLFATNRAKQSVIRAAKWEGPRSVSAGIFDGTTKLVDGSVPVSLRPNTLNIDLQEKTPLNNLYMRMLKEAGATVNRLGDSTGVLTAICWGDKWPSPATRLPIDILSKSLGLWRIQEPPPK